LGQEIRVSLAILIFCISLAESSFAALLLLYLKHAPVRMLSSNGKMSLTDFKGVEAWLNATGNVMLAKPLCLNHHGERRPHNMYI